MLINSHQQKYVRFHQYLKKKCNIVYYIKMGKPKTNRVGKF